MSPMSAAARSSLPASLPAPLAGRVWRGSDLGHASAPVRSSGWARLDAELPGGGWPCGSLTEILVPRTPLLEWRLLGPALARAQASCGAAPLVVVGPPAMPYLPGLQGQGLDPGRLVWVRSQDVAQSLWAAEQVLRAGSAAALLVWLPTCRAEALRRLHAHAHAGRGLVFAVRPEQSRGESSAAPLRVHARPGSPWELCVRLLKRRGPMHEQELRLASIPGGLHAALAVAPAERAVSLRSPGEPRHAVGGLAELRVA